MQNSDFGEDDVLRIQSKMWKAHPILFILNIVLCFAYGLGLLIFGIWWLVTYNRELVVTDSRVRKRTGIFSNQTSELEHKHIRNIQVDQGIIENLMGVGTLKISSSGQSGMEIVMTGIENPEGVRDLIYSQRDE